MSCPTRAMPKPWSASPPPARSPRCQGYSDEPHMNANERKYPWLRRRILLALLLIMTPGLNRALTAQNAVPVANQKSAAQQNSGAIENRKSKIENSLFGINGVGFFHYRDQPDAAKT